MTGKTLLTRPRDCGSVPVKSTKTFPSRKVSETAISSGRSSTPFPSIGSDAEYVPSGRRRLSRKRSFRVVQVLGDRSQHDVAPVPVEEAEDAPDAGVVGSDLCVQVALDFPRCPHVRQEDLGHRVDAPAALDEPGRWDPDPLLVDLAGQREASLARCHRRRCGGRGSRRTSRSRRRRRSGVISVMSGRCVPPWYGSLRMKTSPGRISSAGSGRCTPSLRSASTRRAPGSCMPGRRAVHPR